MSTMCLFLALLVTAAAVPTLTASQTSKQSEPKDMASAEGTQPLDQPDSPVGLLKSCARYAQGMNPSERAFLMVRIAETAARHGYPESTIWSRQAFQVASNLPKDWNRTALQKNALRALAKTRPEEALHLLGTIEGPDFTSDTRIPEDPRASAATEIFVEAYKADGKRSVDELDEVSRFLGQTGEYPYVAWGSLMATFLANNPDDLRQEIRNAVYFYSRATGRIRAEDDEYLQMIEAVQNLAAPSVLKSAVQAGLDHIQSEKFPDNESFMAKSGSPESRVSFNDRKTALLYQWSPLVRKFAPESYASLEKSIPAPNAKTPQQPFTAEIIGQNGASLPELRQRLADRMQEGITIDDATKAPELAMSDAERINSLAVRSDALSSAALAMRDADATWRLKFLSASRSALAQVQTKDSSYLHALADLTAAYYHLDMKEDALEGVQNGLSLGIEVVSESSDAHPETATMLQDGYGDLAELVMIGMRISPRSVLPAVRNLQNGAVQANLMVDIAESLTSGPDKIS